MPALRIAALYDIHGNVPALEAVLEDVRAAGVDAVVVGGDVLPGPMPRECLALLFGLDLPTFFVMGNGDREALAWSNGVESGSIPEPYRDGMRWNAAQLLAQDRLVLAGWPPSVVLQIRGLGDVLFCHATPQNDIDVFTVRTPDDRMRTLLAGLQVPTIVCGHTHMQFDRTIGRTRVVNAGSVGMPFGEPGAYWLLLGPDVQLQRTSYDLKRAAERIRVTPFPQADEFAARNVLCPPSASAMLELFEPATSVKK